MNARGYLAVVAAFTVDASLGRWVLALPASGAPAARLGGGRISVTTRIRVHLTHVTPRLAAGLLSLVALLVLVLDDSTIVRVAIGLGLVCLVTGRFPQNRGKPLHVGPVVLAQLDPDSTGLGSGGGADPTRRLRTAARVSAAIRTRGTRPGGSVADPAGRTGPGASLPRWPS